jgi:hypothetical protein
MCRKVLGLLGSIVSCACRLSHCTEMAVPYLHDCPIHKSKLCNCLVELVLLARSHSSDGRKLTSGSSCRAVSRYAWDMACRLRCGLRVQSSCSREEVGVESWRLVRNQRRTPWRWFQDIWREKRSVRQSTQAMARLRWLLLRLGSVHGAPARIYSRGGCDMAIVQ